jgi:hypothetical protein
MYNLWELIPEWVQVRESCGVPGAGGGAMGRLLVWCGYGSRSAGTGRGVRGCGEDAVGRLRVPGASAGTGVRGRGEDAVGRMWVPGASAGRGVRGCGEDAVGDAGVVRVRVAECECVAAGWMRWGGCGCRVRVRVAECGAAGLQGLWMVKGPASRY